MKLNSLVILLSSWFGDSSVSHQLSFQDHAIPMVLFLAYHLIVILIFLTFGFFALFCGYYILWAYLFVGAILFYIGLERFYFSKETLQIENNKIDEETLPAKFELQYYHVIFLSICLYGIYFFHIFIGFLYFLFIIVGVVGGFFKFNIYELIKPFYMNSKTFKKDRNVLKYHWGTRFFYLKMLYLLTLFALPIGVFVLVLALPLHRSKDPVLFLNIVEMVILLLSTYTLSFCIDVYIIFFGNSSVVNKGATLCYQCTLYGIGCLMAGGYVEKQLIHNSSDFFSGKMAPNLLTNLPRILTGRPIVLDYDQYWQHHLIQKYLPDTPEKEYVKPRNFMVSQIDSTRANQLIIKQWPIIAEHATREDIIKSNLGGKDLSFNQTLTRRW